MSWAGGRPTVDQARVTVCCDGFFELGGPGRSTGRVGTVGLGDPPLVAVWLRLVERWRCESACAGSNASPRQLTSRPSARSKLIWPRSRSPRPVRDLESGGRENMVSRGRTGSFVCVGRIALIVCCLSVGSVQACAASSPARRRCVLVIGVDGCRPDCLTREWAPTLYDLIHFQPTKEAASAYSLRSQGAHHRSIHARAR